MEIKGIDVSSYQSKPDWAKVSNSEIKFAILRIHQKSGTDSSFEHNYKGCKSNGILVGGYKYSYALTPAQAIDEAESVISVLGGRGMDFPIFYDLEWSQQRNLGKQAIENIAVAFLTRIKKAGYKVGIYCNLDWYNNVLSDTLKKYDCWIARYPASDNGSVQERLRPSVGVGWQYSSRGKVSGISGNVDMDVFYKDYKEEVSAMDKAIEKVILIAKNEIGYLEKKSNSQLDSKTANAGSNNYTKYWRDIKPSYQGQPWCAAFVSWCFMEALGQEKEGSRSAGFEEALIAAGSACVNGQDFDTAKSLYEEALNSGKTGEKLESRIYNQLGLCQMAEEDYNTAADSFDKGYNALITGYKAGTGAELDQAAAAVPQEDIQGMTLLKELVYNKAVCLEYSGQYRAAQAEFEHYISVFGADENAQHEIDFLKTRQEES